MNNIRLFILSITILLTITGCSQPRSVTTLKQVKPSWIINPNENNNIGAIGVSSRTHDQKISTQRKLAITRALEELSLQHGVKVQLNMKKQEKLNNDRTNTHIEVNSNFETNNNISAHIEGSWQDNYTSELYIWMVMD